MSGSRGTRGQWFANAMAAISGRLPFGLPDVVPPNVVGYLIINGCTFCLDLGLLTVFYGGLKLWLPLATTMAYGIASLVSYTCNRILNFQSHGAVGTQLPLYIGILTVNYLAFILGLQEGLHNLGVEYQVARVLAACCEGVFLYCCMRWLVFRDAMGSPQAKPAGHRHDTAGQASRGGTPGPAAEGEGTASATGGGKPTPESPRPVPAQSEGL